MATPHSHPAPGRRAVLPALLAGGLVLAGCQGTLYRTTGNLMGDYAGDHLVPYLMGSEDLGLACEVGVSLGPFLLSFERVTDPPAQAALVSWLGAGMCAEESAWEAELAGLRAARAGAAAEAEDARIREKQAHAVAAARFLAAWTAAQAAFPAEGGACPDLDGVAAPRFLLGLSAGVLAVLHDKAAGGLAGVPLDIPGQVLTAADCLDDARWWGAPAALKAALAAALPGAEVDGEPWATLEAAAARGEAAGVRLARAFQVQALAAAGREAELKRAVEAHAGSLAERAPDPTWRLLDRYATALVRHESDRLWTRDSGHRTPLGALGRFPDEATPEVDDSLLEGLED